MVTKNNHWENVRGVRATRDLNIGSESIGREVSLSPFFPFTPGKISRFLKKNRSRIFDTLEEQGFAVLKPSCEPWSVTKLRWNKDDAFANGWVRLKKYRSEYRSDVCNFHNDDQFDARAIVSCDQRAVPIGIAHRKDVSAAENADPHMRDGGYECQLMMNANLQKEMAVYWSQVWTCMIFPSGTTNRKIDHARMTVDTHGQTKIADFMASNYVDDARMYYQDLCK